MKNKIGCNNTVGVVGAAHLSKAKSRLCPDCGGRRGRKEGCINTTGKGGAALLSLRGGKI